jgi:hypothetical protein
VRTNLYAFVHRETCLSVQEGDWGICPQQAKQPIRVTPNRLFLCLGTQTHRLLQQTQPLPCKAGQRVSLLKSSIKV